MTPEFNELGNIDSALGIYKKNFKNAVGECFFTCTTIRTLAVPKSVSITSSLINTVNLSTK
jgi:hypothetical protein